MYTPHPLPQDPDVAGLVKVLWLRTLCKLRATALGHTVSQTGIVFWSLPHTWEACREQAFTQVATCAPGPPNANKFITHSRNPIPLSPILSLEHQLVSSDLSHSRTICFISTTTSCPVPSSFLASQPGLSCVLPEKSCVCFYVTWGTTKPRSRPTDFPAWGFWATLDSAANLEEYWLVVQILQWGLSPARSTQYQGQDTYYYLFCMVSSCLACC